MGDVAKGAGKLVKGAIYNPIANVADMLKWQTYRTPEGDTVHVDPQGKEYSDREYNMEVMRRTGGMTLAALGLNSAPGVGSAAGPGVVAGANRIGLKVSGEPMPTPTATPILNDASLLPSAPPSPFKTNALTQQAEMGSVSLPSSAPTMRGQIGPMSTPTRSGVGMTPAPAISAQEAAAVGNQVRTNAAAARPAPPPFPPPPGRAPMPAIPTPPPAGAPPAAVKSWFGQLSAKQKAGLGLAATGAGFTYAMIDRAAETARKQQAQPAAAGSSSSPSDWQGPPNLSDWQGPELPTTAAKTTPAPFKARATATMRAATGGNAQGAAQTAAADMAAGQPSGTDKVPMTTTGKPDYNYYAEMMNAADRNDAYARDLINLKEQARMAAIDAAARGEKFRFVPVKDYMNNRIIFVNAGGNDVVLDMNDPRQGVEYQKLLDKSGVDSATMTDWMHRSSRPMLRYMQPAGGARDVTPDFGFARRSVEMGAGGAMTDADKYKLPDIAHVGSTELPKFGQTRGMDLEPEAEMPTPSATPPATRPEPQPTAVAAVAPQTEEDAYAENLKRLEEQRKAKGITPAQGRRIDQSKRWTVGG
jgi:hypothetical protein